MILSAEWKLFSTAFAAFRHLFQSAEGRRHCAATLCAARHFVHHAADHFAHLLELVQELVDFLDGLRTPGGDPSASRSIDRGRRTALGGRH